MELRDVTPMLRTDDLDGSIRFYTEVLGFRCEAIDEDWGWASVARDQVAVMLATPLEDERFDKARFTGSLYFYPDDVDEAWQALKDRARICYPIEDFSYGMREFGIFDPNGYLLQFGAAIEASTGDADPSTVAGEAETS